MDAQTDGQNGEKINSKDEVEAAPEFHPSREQFVGVADTKKVIYQSEVGSASGHNTTPTDSCNGERVNSKDRVQINSKDKVETTPESQPPDQIGRTFLMDAQPGGQNGKPLKRDYSIVRPFFGYQTTEVVQKTLKPPVFLSTRP